MALESKQLLVDDLKRYSDGLINALKREEFFEAREYVTSMRNVTESVSDYLASQISLEETNHGYATASDVATTEAERAVLAAKRAKEKVERLEKAADETAEESKRLRKAAKSASKDADKARKAAERAEKSENKAHREAKKASEQAAKANQAARRS